jgi:hypothetical protein
MGPIAEWCVNVSPQEALGFCDLFTLTLRGRDIVTPILQMRREVACPGSQAFKVSIRTWSHV